MFGTEMKVILKTIISLVLAITQISGCGGKSLPEGAKIQINVPDGPSPTSKTKLITLDVVEGRDVFEDFFRTARRVRRCSPTKIENDNSAHEVITISFWGEAIFRVYKDWVSFCILKNQQGEWITKGYGGVEVYDIPEGFPKYKYSRRSVNRVKQWYEKYVPEENRKR